jgi:hypothetical protein
VFYVGKKIQRYPKMVVVVKKVGGSRFTVKYFGKKIYINSLFIARGYSNNTRHSRGEEGFPK